MSDSSLPKRFSRPARCILHPTDFSPESHRALAHALRLALHNQADLVILHVGMTKDSESFPSVREVLQRWGMIAPDAPRSAVVDLGIGIDKVEAHGPTVSGAIINFMEHEPVDMLVMATHGRRGLSSWFNPSTAEETARRTQVPTLFIPASGREIVAEDDGKVSLHRVLVPVDHEPSGDEAVERGIRALRGFGDDVAELTLLHVGEEKHFPHVSLSRGDWNLQRVCRAGTPSLEILAEAEESNADLLIMTTEGRHGFFDALRGTTTEQVLHGTPCPLLAVPA